MYYTTYTMAYKYAVYAALVQGLLMLMYNNFFKGWKLVSLSLYKKWHCMVKNSLLQKKWRWTMSVILSSRWNLWKVLH